MAKVFTVDVHKYLKVISAPRTVQVECDELTLEAVFEQLKIAIGSATVSSVDVAPDNDHDQGGPTPSAKLSALYSALSPQKTISPPATYPGPALFDGHVSEEDFNRFRDGKITDFKEIRQIFGGIPHDALINEAKRRNTWVGEEPPAEKKAKPRTDYVKLVNEQVPGANIPPLNSSEFNEMVAAMRCHQKPLPKLEDLPPSVYYPSHEPLAAVRHLHTKTTPNTTAQIKIQKHNESAVFTIPKSECIVDTGADTFCGMKKYTSWENR